MNILFVCTANKLRSPTAAAIFAGKEGLEVRSAGLDPAAPTRFDEELAAWADKIYTMERHHREKIRKKYRNALGAKPIVSLEIPDEYEILLVLALGKPVEQVVIDPVGEDGDVKYWRDADGVHHVPKRSLDELILDL